MNDFYPKTKDIIILIYDHNDNKTYKDKPPSKEIFKDYFIFTEIDQLNQYIEEKLSPNDKISFFIHAMMEKNYRWVNGDFSNQELTENKVVKPSVFFKNEYPELHINYITKGDPWDSICKYGQRYVFNFGELRRHFEQNEIIPQLVSDFYVFKDSSKKSFSVTETFSKLSNNFLVPNESMQTGQLTNIDFAIITAVEEDEMEKVLPIISKEGCLNNIKHLIEYGYLTANPNKKIAYASQQSTGMIDAAILATELIHFFHPKFLIMAGVLGGKPKDVNIGDIIVATKVFTVDKGKFSDLGFQKEIESSSTDNAFITRFKREKEKISTFIKKCDQTRKRNIEIHFGPIACVRQVIDFEGFFEENISVIDRKAIALEMESYGVSRACELVNNGNTIPLIIKAAMDNTIEKVDDAKTYAAWNSAMFVKYILENDLI